MPHGNRCRICHSHFREEDFVTCDACGETYHASCLEYHESYECEGCADDLAVGVVEF